MNRYFQFHSFLIFFLPFVLFLAFLRKFLQTHIFRAYFNLVDVQKTFHCICFKVGVYVRCERRLMRIKRFKHLLPHEMNTLKVFIKKVYNFFFFFFLFFLSDEIFLEDERRATTGWCERERVESNVQESLFQQNFFTSCNFKLRPGVRLSCEWVQGWSGRFEIMITFNRR